MQQLRLTLFFCLLLIGLCFGQKRSPKAEKMVKQATDLVNSGDVESAIPLLEKARTLAPKDPQVLYQLAYAEYLSGNYKDAITLLKGAVEKYEVSEDHYQLLGNSFDQLGRPDSAMTVYGKGITKFPASGKLYYESGLLKYNSEKYNEAIDWWEKGVDAAPMYSGNYYELARLFSHSDEKIWSLLYGEMFINLERETPRTTEISKLLYTTYTEILGKQKTLNPEISLTHKGFESAGAGEISWEQLKQQNLGFEGTFAVTFCTAAKPVATQTERLKSIYKAREGFLGYWFGERKYAEKYKNILLSRWEKLKEAGHLEAYTFWLLSEGNFKEYNQYIQNHKTDFTKFQEFLKTDSFKVTTSDIYSRNDYVNGR